MGALHNGHIALIERSKQDTALTVCSIFVNPTQFNNSGDYKLYPITIEKDIALLEAAGTDVLFLPSITEMYPNGTAGLEHYDLGYLETVLEGKYRPGHFQGVCLVVSRLLNIIPAGQLYRQTDTTDDILGNLGFGVAYSLYRTSRLKTSLQFEGEGFYGRRSQDSLEVVPIAPGFQYKHAKIDNDLYGGIGRMTARFEYSLGRSGLFKLFADGGVQGKFTLINYSGLGSFDELLWGPYAKVGFRYSF